MKKIGIKINTIAILLMACLTTFSIVSCDWNEDEPQVEPTPTPNPTPENDDPLIIETTPLMGYDWNGYSNDLCMMSIKTFDSNPQISTNSTQSWIKTFVSKGEDSPDNNGYYTFYVFANIDKNNSQTARDFKIKANVKINHQGSNITESEELSCIQYGYTTIDDFDKLNKKVAKWQLRSEVKLSKSNSGKIFEYIKNDYFDKNKFLNRAYFTVETIIGVIEDYTRNGPMKTKTTDRITTSYFTGENIENTFINNCLRNGEFVFGMEEIIQEEVYSDSTVVTHNHYQHSLISITEKELILQREENSTFYSFHFTALE